MSSPTYPVRVDATLDDQLSRWLWLVKWLLAIPHYIVLAFLWLAFVLLSIFALVAIVFTGRYPRGIFDFNVGVLRWSWRVAYYTYGGLGTDRYPPFSLEERPDYPAHLEVGYPDQLSRGLVLVKWWLLAIPHYLVVALFLGTGLYVVSDGANDTVQGWNPGLIGLLVLIAAVVLLFTGRYPRPIFDLVLGLNRWVLRVAAYVSLMTDQYPPFRLDMGGSDPGTGVLAVGQAPGPGPAPAPTRAPSPIPTAQPFVAQPYAGQAYGPPGGQPPPPAAGTPPAPRPTHWGPGRVLAVIVASVITVTALGVLAGGLALRLGDGFARDSQGFLMSDSQTFSSRGYAITSENIELHNGSSEFDVPERWLGTVKIEADARTANGVFIGVARTGAVNAYLNGVARSTVTDPVGDNGDPVSTFAPGVGPGRAPGDAAFWTVSSQGGRHQSVTWNPTSGSWTLVVMNAAGSSPVSADVAIGADLPIVDNVAIIMLVVGSVLLVLGVLFLVLAVRRPQGAQPTSPAVTERPGAP